MQANPPPRYDLGNCTVTLVSGGQFKLDGGAMFGLIPKALWSRSYPADDQNRILLACNCLLVERPGTDRRVLIETGHGSKYTPKEQNIFALDPTCWLRPNLLALGVDPASITDVVVSHLHFDHAGGLTHNADGQLKLTFPNARVYVHKPELDDACANFGIMTATYRAENYSPLCAADAWRVIEGATEIAPGIHTLPTPGHTRGHHSIAVQGSDRVLAFGGDLMPTRHHLGAAYNMAYDLYPLDNRASKQQMLTWLAERDGLYAFDHELETPVVSVRRKGEWFELTAESSDR
jgi:glyoxylase-like metal-dependent hydrolase (beta-lactamase superfamily II)